MQENYSIKNIKKNTSYLEVEWNDGQKSKFNYLWLRDNCPSAMIKTLDIECLIF